MTYNEKINENTYTKAEKEKILQKSIKVAKDKGLFFASDVCVFLPITEKTFYDWEFHKCEKLKETLSENKVNVKVKLRKNWESSTSATLQIALYKLVATEEERKILADNQTIKVEDMPEIKIGIRNN